MIELHGVAVRFGETQVLSGVTQRIEAEDHVTITGRSGSGKSTLLNLIAGTLRVNEGRVTVDGRNMASASERVDVQRDVIGYLFQSAHLVGWMDALDNVELGMRYQRIPAGQRRERARDALTQVGLADRCRHKPAQLSGGERQRVALARAVARRPRVLLADEPTGNLDDETGLAVIELMESLPGVALVLVTHDRSLADRGAHCWSVRDGSVHSRTAGQPEHGHAG